MGMGREVGVTVRKIKWLLARLLRKCSCLHWPYCASVTGYILVWPQLAIL